VAKRGERARRADQALLGDLRVSRERLSRIDQRKISFLSCRDSPRLEARRELPIEQLPPIGRKREGRASGDDACHATSRKQAWKNVVEVNSVQRRGRRRKRAEDIPSAVDALRRGVFYDFLRSHNKVRQRISHNGTARSFLLSSNRPRSFRFRRRAAIVFARRRLSPVRPGKYGRSEILYADYPRWSFRAAR